MTWKTPLRRLLDQGPVTPKQAAAALEIDPEVAARRLREIWVKEPGILRRFDLMADEWTFWRKETDAV